MTAQWELDYLALIRSIIAGGKLNKNRTGVDTYAMTGAQLRIPVINSILPALVCRPVYPKIAIEEMMFFLRGESDTQTLRDKNIHIWDGNTNRKFLDDHHLGYLPEWNMGRGYGVQMRSFGSAYVSERNPYADQIETLIEDIVQNPTSRRLLVTHWNPNDHSKAALPPCHVMHQYIIDGDQMDCVLTMRSCDLVYGLPYNAMEYAFLMNWLCNVVAARSGKVYHPRELVINMGNAHVYVNQVDYIEAAMKDRATPVFTAYPSLRIGPSDDAYSMQYGKEITCSGYVHFPEPEGVIKPNMAA